MQTGATTPKGLLVITQLKIVHLFKNKFTVTTQTKEQRNCESR